MAKMLTVRLSKERITAMSEYAALREAMVANGWTVDEVKSSLSADGVIYKFTSPSGDVIFGGSDRGVDMHTLGNLRKRLARIGWFL